VAADQLSPYNQSFVAKFDTAPYTPDDKLVPNLRPKTGYVVHFAALKQMLGQGLRLTVVRRCLQFDQSPWMKPYIDFCVAQRQAATSDFHRDLFKLLMNSVFGKTMENVRKRRSLRLFTPADRRLLLRKVASPFVRAITVLSPTLVAVESYPTTVKLHKPIYCGAAILDIAKTLVYDFHYNTMMARYGHERCRLLFTDTDSLCYHIQTQDVYRDMAAFQHRLDTSAYPASHFLHDPANAKVAGKFKDETHGRPITQFVGLKASCTPFAVCPRRKWEGALPAATSVAPSQPLWQRSPSAPRGSHVRRWAGPSPWSTMLACCGARDGSGWRCTRSARAITRCTPSARARWRFRRLTASVGFATMVLPPLRMGTGGLRP
jgi:hypothetical protein